MSMYLRQAEGEQSLDILDEEGVIGCIYFSPDEEDPEVGWVATMCRARECGEWVSDPCETVLEAVRQAWRLYDCLLEERREVARFYRNRGWRVIATPMGGQPRS